MLPSFMIRDCTTKYTFHSHLYPQQLDNTVVNILAKKPFIFTNLFYLRNSLD